MWEDWRIGSAPVAPPPTLDYHHRIADAASHFDRVENTLSHAFSHPHRALGGRRYGEAVCDQLLADGHLRAGAHVLEVGCGSGRLASALLDRLRTVAPAVYASMRYTLYDASPALQAEQRTTCAAHVDHLTFQIGDIETDPVAGGPFDLVLSNEVIADLRVGVASLERVSEGRPETEAEHLVVDRGLSTAGEPRRFVVNLGAARLVERSGRDLLAPGGVACLTEYGDVAAFPSVVHLPGHDEYSIHFGHLVALARAAGCAPSLESVGTWLGFDGTVRVLSHASYHALAVDLLPALGLPDLPALAWDDTTLAATVGDAVFRDLGNLEFRPLAEGRFMSPFEFQLFTMRAPYRPPTSGITQGRVGVW